MPKFEFIMTRDTTESTWITVEAGNADDAHEIAMAKASKLPLSDWERDECASSDPYMTDCTELGSEEEE